MNIRELRLSMGLSQSKFAEKFHIRVDTLRTWEQGVRDCPESIFYMVNRIVELEKALEAQKEG